EPDSFDERAATDGDEHEIRLHHLAVAKMNRELRAVVLHLRALLLEVERDAAPAELLRELLRRVRVLLRDERRQHLDDRHLAADALEDRRELAADDPPAEHDEPPRNVGLPEQALGVDAARRVD